MREYKFRGKCRKETKGDHPVKVGEWVYGYVAQHTSGTYIIRPVTLHGTITTFDWVEVDPETVGQWREMMDMNGKEIYEGDILRAADGSIGAVEFQHGCFVWGNDGLPLVYAPDEGFEVFPTETWATVIGNIHQHAELLTTQK